MQTLERRQLWIAACLDCGIDVWEVFEFAYLRERWIDSHVADTAHEHIELWNGLSAV